MSNSRETDPSQPSRPCQHRQSGGARQPRLSGHPGPYSAGDGSFGRDLTIDCEQCVLRHTDACDDCVVSFLLCREPDDAVVIDADEARAMRMLGRAGLVPELRFSTQVR